MSSHTALYLVRGALLLVAMVAPGAVSSQEQEGHAREKLPVDAAVAQQSNAGRFMSDEEFLKIGQDFDLDAYIAGRNPPTIETLMEHLRPMPTISQLLDDLAHPERRPQPPALPEDVARQVNALRKRIDELKRQSAAGDDAQAQDEALEEAIRLVNEEVALRAQAGQPPDWYEYLDAQWYASTLELLRELPPAARRELVTADARGGECAALQAKAQYKQALVAARSHVAVRLRYLPAECPAVALHLNNLAFALQNLGELSEAESLYCDVLDMRQRLFPSNHPDSALILNNIAYILEARGAPAEAEALFCDALATWWSLCPDDHQYVALGLNNVALFLQNRGALAEAEPMYRDALAMRRRLCHGPHPDVALALSNLASLLGDRDALDEAKLLSEEALAMWRQLFPGDHPDVALAMNNLAEVHKARGALAEAEPLLRDTLAMNQRLFRGDHPYVAATLSNLAQVLRERGALDEAEPLYRDSLAMCRRLFPGDHPGKATSIANLAELCQAKGALAEAEPLYREALAMQQRLFPGDHPAAALALNNLARILKARGALDEAEPLYHDALAMAQRLHPGDNPQVAGGLNNIAGVLSARGERGEAEQYYRDALAMKRRLYDWDHPSLAMGLYSLASVLIYRGALVEAESLLREALEMSERLRTQIVGGEQERAEFAEQLGLKERAQSYAHVLTQLHRDGEALGILERGRARAALDLLVRSGRDLVAETAALGDAERSRRLAEAQDAEARARIDLTSTEALLAGRRKERDVLERREDLDAEMKAKGLADYDQQIAALLDGVKRKRQELTQASGTVLTELRGLFPAGQALSTEEIVAGLSPDEVVISYSWAGNGVLVAIATNGKTSAMQVTDGKNDTKQLGEMVNRLRSESASRPGFDDTIDPALTQELAATLFPDPVTSAIADAQRLVVLPDGSLNNVPLEILIEAVPALADKAIAYAPSATVYLDRKKRRDSRTNGHGEGAATAVVLGDPIFDRGHPEQAYPKNGALVVATIKGGNAAEAGMRRGDVLLRYDGLMLDAQTPLSRATGAVNEAIHKGERPADDAVKIIYWRDGQEAEVELPPGRMGVRIQPGSPADGLRSMALLDRGFDAMAAQANALDQVRLFGGSLSRLAGTRRESEAIAALFNSTEARRHADTESADVSPAARLLLGEDATMARLTEAVHGARYVHLATHGLMGSADTPYDASLALTQPEKPTPEDIGFLTLKDLIGQWGGRLEGCELVVLSACDTQRGVRKGDTVMSLPLGFFFAGARTVVASLWKVDDQATTLLMTRLYENLLGEFDTPRTIHGRTFQPGQHLPKLAALDEAKHWLRDLTRDELRNLQTSGPLAMVDDTSPEERGAEVAHQPVPDSADSDHPYEHPYYWSAFVLYGDPE